MAKKNKKRKLQQKEEDEKPSAKQDKRSNKSKRNKHSVVTDERFASVHFDPRFQRVPKKDSKVPIDSRFARMLSDRSFASSSASVDKRGKKEKEANPLLRYYHNQDEKEREKEKEEEDEKRESGSETESSDEREGDESSSTDDDEDDYDYDEYEDLTQSDISRYLMANHEDTPLTEQETHRLAVVNMDWDHIKLDELNEYLASSGDSDAGDEEAESDGSENEDSVALPNGKGKKHMDREKLRALLLSGDASGSEKDNDDQDMEITFNTGLEDLSKRILEKKDKKSETVWEQVLRKRSEKRKARKNRSKDSSEDDSSNSDVQEAAEQHDDFFMEEEHSDSDTDVGNNKNKDTPKSKQGKSSRKEREESPDKDEEQEATKAELELLFAEDHDGKGQGAKGYKVKPKKHKGKKGKEASVEAKLPDVDVAADPRFSALFTSHLYALDPTDPQFKRSAAYARQQFGKQRTSKGAEQAEETTNAPEQIQIVDSDPVPVEKEKHELSSTVRSLKRNLGNLKKGTKGR